MLVPVFSRLFVVIFYLCIFLNASSAILEHALKPVLSRQASHLILVALDWTRPKDPPLSLGHASILTDLRKHNLNVTEKSWSVNSPSFSPQKVVDFAMNNVRDNKTDFALGAFVWNEEHTQNILNGLKKASFPGRVILGGPQISYLKEGLEKFYPQADVFIRGYAEEALKKLMTSSINNSVIRGVHYAGQPDLGLSALGNLEDLSSPFLTGIIRPQPFIRWETQRGCPFRCAFCQHRESDTFAKRRAFLESRIIEEARWITQHPMIQDVAVLDPIFNSGPYYLRILDQLIEGRYSGKISFQARLEMVNSEFLEKITQLNTTAQTVLEFGLQTIHSEEQKIIDRPNNMRRVRKTLEELHQRRIHTEVSLIFGLPNQTLSSFKESISFCRDLNVPVIRAFPLMLLRGTPLYYQKEQLRLIESTEIAYPSDDRLQEGLPHVVSSPSFTYLEWQEMAKIAQSLEK